MQRHIMFMDWENLVTMLVLSKLNYRFNTIPKKSQ